METQYETLPHGRNQRTVASRLSQTIPYRSPPMGHLVTPRMSVIFWTAALVMMLQVTQVSSQTDTSSSTTAATTTATPTTTTTEATTTTMTEEPTTEMPECDRWEYMDEQGKEGPDHWEYMDEQGVCHNCTLQYCSNCSSADICIDCHAGFKLTDQGKCSCGSGNVPYDDTCKHTCGVKVSDEGLMEVCIAVPIGGIAVIVAIAVGVVFGLKNKRRSQRPDDFKRRPSMPDPFASEVNGPSRDIPPTDTEENEMDPNKKLSAYDQAPYVPRYQRDPTMKENVADLKPSSSSAQLIHEKDAASQHPNPHIIAPKPHNIAPKPHKIPPKPEINNDDQYYGNLPASNNNLPAATADSNSDQEDYENVPPKPKGLKSQVPIQGSTDESFPPPSAAGHTVPGKHGYVNLPNLKDSAVTPGAQKHGYVNIKGMSNSESGRPVTKSRGTRVESVHQGSGNLGYVTDDEQEVYENHEVTRKS